ncbi:MAG: hypothetical protein ABI239_01675 [Aquihabitans sp.]
MTPASHGHSQLLTLARKAEAAASDGDPERLENTALTLFEALIAHVDQERSDLAQLAPAQRRLLVRGQQRVVDLLVELAIEAQAPGPCQCTRLSRELSARLSLQADDERRAGIAPPAW